MAQLQNNRIIFDESDFLAGLHPNFSATATDTPIPRGTSSQLTFVESMNPYRNFGYASPGFDALDVTNVSVVTNSAIRHIVMGAETSTNYGYGINSNTKLFQLDADSGALTNAGVWPHTMAVTSGACEGQDVAIYSAKVAGTRAPRLFYSLNCVGATAGDALWDVGVYSLDGSTFDDNFMTTAPATPLDSTNSATLSSASDKMPHPMIVGDDDLLYIADGNYLHAYDGNSSADAEGKFIPQVLKLPATFRITAFAKYQRKLAIFGYYQPQASASANPSSFYATKATVFWWDYLNLDPYDASELNDNYVSCAVPYNGTIACFTQGRKPVPGSNQFSRLQIYNGVGFETVAMFDKNVPIWGGAEVVGDTLMWNSQGQIMQFGSPYVGFRNGLNKATKGDGVLSGAIKLMTTTLQVASTGLTTTGGLQKITTRFNTGSFATAVVQPTFAPGYKGLIKSIKVTFAGTASGGRDISLYVFGNGLAVKQFIVTETEITASNIVREYYEEDLGTLTFRDLALAVVWGSGSDNDEAPILESVEVTFEPINIEET